LQSTKTGLGQLKSWWWHRYKPFDGVKFEDRTPGDLLEEFYGAVAIELAQLQGVAGLNTAQFERLEILEQILEPEDRHALAGMSGSAAEEEWNTIHRTGDPLGDYWEYRIVKDLLTDDDWLLTEAPPRDEWDNTHGRNDRNQNEDQSRA